MANLELGGTITQLIFKFKLSLLNNNAIGHGSPQNIHPPLKCQGHKENLMILFCNECFRRMHTAMLYGDFLKVVFASNDKSMTQQRDPINFCFSLY